MLKVSNDINLMYTPERFTNELMKLLCHNGDESYHSKLRSEILSFANKHYDIGQAAHISYHIDAYDNVGKLNTDDCIYPVTEIGRQDIVDITRKNKYTFDVQFLYQEFMLEYAQYCLYVSIKYGPKILVQLK